MNKKQSQNRDFKGVWIPKEIWENHNLTWMEKLVLVEINSLDGENGCFASNNYLAEFFNLSAGRISQIIKSLESKKMIEIEYIRNKGVIEKRVIRILNGVFNILNGVFNNLNGGYLENAEGNNTEAPNNTRKNNNIFPSGSRQKPEAAKKRIKVNCNTETMKRIGRWFNRQESTLWSVYEAVALEQVAPGEAQIKGMEQFYTADLPPDNDYRRRSVETLLNNWHTELDKAREYARKNKPQQQETIL